MKVFLDTCMLVYAVEAPNTIGLPVLKALSDVIESSDFCVSQLVKMECLVKPAREGDVVLAGQYLSILNGIEFLDLSPEVFSHAASLRGRHLLRTPDAIHLATAIRHECEEFWTNDDRLARVPARINFRRIS